MVVAARVTRAPDVTWAGPCGGNDHKEFTISIEKLTDDVKSVQAWQPQIYQGDVRLKRFRHHERFSDVTGNLNHMPLALADPCQRPGGVRIVFDDLPAKTSRIPFASLCFAFSAVIESSCSSV
jgi:hypothetical protein